jgi:hypothetical protein
VKHHTHDWTYGVEHEWGNCSRKVELPEGNSWNFDDNTCVSTTGIANDPKAELYEFGGEINTKPTDTIEEQCTILRDLDDLLNPVVNYRSNLHIHIRVPGLKDDLSGLRRLLQYVDINAQDAFDLVEPIPKPNKNQPASHFEWETKRYKRRLKSHQSRLTDTQVERMLGQDNPHDFYLAEAHKNPDGKPAWFQVPRAGINIRQIFEHSETLEFRHFPGTLNPDELHSAIKWCHLFLESALNDGDSPQGLFDSQVWNFPTFPEYDYYAEQVYQYTNFDKNTRRVVQERLRGLREVIDIDDLNTTAKSVCDHMPNEEEDHGVLPI